MATTSSLDECVRDSPRPEAEQVGKSQTSPIRRAFATCFAHSADAVFSGQEPVPTASLAELQEKLSKSKKFNQNEYKFIQMILECGDFSEANRIGLAYKMANMEIEIPGQLPTEQTDAEETATEQELRSLKRKREEPDAEKKMRTCAAACASSAL
jgi:hypothetical protein